MSLKICVVSTPVFKLGGTGLGGYGGLEQIAWLSAKGLAELGHQVSLVAPDGSECPGVEIISIGPERQVNEAMAYNRYWQRLSEFDAIVDHSWSKFCMHGKREGWLKAPCLLVMHAPVNTMLTTLPPGVDKPCFVCISEDQKNHFEALFSHPARRAYNGVDTEFYKPIEGVKRTDRFLFLARFSSIKGPDLAIEACKKAGVGLDLVGDLSITNEPELYEKCKAMCDGKQIRMVGPCSRGETVWWYSQAHALLHPNLRFREPLGLAPVESQSCETPVLAWRYGAMGETISHGVSGFLVSSVDEMVDLIKTNAVALLDRKRCRDWVASKFTVDTMVRRYEQLCKEALETGGW